MSFAKESIRTLLVRFSIILFNLVGGIINARYLGATGLGIFTLLATIPSLCFRFGNFGIGSSLSFFVAKKKLSSAHAYTHMWKASIILSLICCCLMIPIRGVKYLPWYDIPTQLYYISLLLIPLAFIQNFLTRIVAGKLQIIELNIADFIGIVSYLLSLFILIIHLNFGILGAIYALIINRCIVSFVLFVRCPPNGLAISTTQEKLPETKKIKFNKLWEYGKWNYLIMLNRYLLDQLPVFFLKYATTNEAVGLFSIARGVNNKIQIIPDTFATILFPFNAAAEKEQAIQRTNRVTRCFFFLMILITVLLFLFIKPVILIIYGNSYAASVPIFHTLLPVVICFPLYKLQNVHIAATGSSKTASLISIAALPIGVALSFLLIPHHGAVGASSAISITYFFQFMLSILIYGKTTKSSLTEMFLLNLSDLKSIRDNILSTTHRA